MITIIKRPICLTLLAAGVNLCVVITGCKTESTHNTPIAKAVDFSSPMHASLDDLTRESRGCRWNTVSPDYYPSMHRFFASLVGIKYFSPGEWDARTVVSLSGQLPMPAVGLAYHWTQDSSPVTAVPMNWVGQSYWLEGVCQTNVAAQELQSGVQALTQLQDDAVAGLNLVLATLAEARTVTNSGQDLTPFVLQLSNHVHSMSLARSNVLDKLMKPGVITGRWAAEKAKGGKMDASPFGNVSGSSKRSDGGFFILNGLIDTCKIK